MDENNQITKANPSFTTLGMPANSSYDPVKPRHMTITTKMKHSPQKAYVLYEAKLSISMFKVDETTGKLTNEKEVETLPKKMAMETGEHGAEIALHPSESWLYISHRGTGSIIVYKVLDNGDLKRLEVIVKLILM